MARAHNPKGAGRPKGSKNKATEKQIKAVAKTGITPLDYLLKVMRDGRNEQAERVDAARIAAPYVHAKLTAIDHSSADGSMSPQPTIDPAKLGDDTMADILNAAKPS